MRTRLELYRALADLTAGDARHLHLHLASIRPMIISILDELGFTPALFSQLRWCAEYGSHGELVFKCMQIHNLIKGK